MAQEEKIKFSSWIEVHPYREQIEDFLLWAEIFEDINFGHKLHRQSRKQLLDALMYLDDLSQLMLEDAILKAPIFKPGQYFNPDKLLRAAKKNALITEVLAEAPAEMRPQLEESLWYTMRLYSIFLDFYHLSEEESRAFTSVIADLSLPKNVLRRHQISWGLISVFVILLVVFAIIGLVLTSHLVSAIIVGLILGISAVAWIIFSFLQSLPYQFKNVMKKQPLLCVRGQVCDVGEGHPFSSSSFRTQTVHISTLHDSLGKNYTFYGLSPLSCKTDGTHYQLVYLQVYNIIVAILPIE